MPNARAIATEHRAWSRTSRVLQPGRRFERVRLLPDPVLQYS